MNYCSKCASLYAQPGTCNCFAPPRQLQPIPVHPIIAVPYIGDPPQPAAPSWTKVTLSAVPCTSARVVAEAIAHAVGPTGHLTPNGAFTS